MKLILLVLFFVCPFHCISQMITDTTFFGTSNKIRSYGIYDTGQRSWRLYQFYPTGELEQTRKLDPVTFRDNDTSVVYHPNGKIAWIFPYCSDSGLLTGRLLGYYPTGSVKREAEYYRQFRTGTWKEYYPNGQVRSISQYQITQEDSVFMRLLTSDDYSNGFAEAESFEWGEGDSVSINNTIFLCHTTAEIFSLVSIKAGVWKTYDPSGKLISRKNYKR